VVEGRTLLSKLLSSETKGELLILFRRNPGIMDTVEGVARRIGKRANAVEPDVKEFLDLGLLKRKRIGNAEVIFLNTKMDKKIQEGIAKYLDGLRGSKP